MRGQVSCCRLKKNFIGRLPWIKYAKSTYKHCTVSILDEVIQAGVTRPNSTATCCCVLFCPLTLVLLINRFEANYLCISLSLSLSLN